MKARFRELELCQFILSGLKTPHNIQLLNFFGEFHTWARFSLEEETVSSGHDEKQGGSIHLCSFFESSSCVKIDTKKAAFETREEELMPWWLSTHPRLPFPSPWMECYYLANVLYTHGCLRIKDKQNDLHIYYQTMRLADVLYVCVHEQVTLVHVNCHLFKSRMLSLQTHRHKLPR